MTNGVSGGGSAVKNLPALQETEIQSLGQEDPLEKEILCSSILAWEIPCTEVPGGLQSRGSQKSGTRLQKQTKKMTNDVAIFSCATFSRSLWLIFCLLLFIGLFIFSQFMVCFFILLIMPFKNKF